MTTLGWRTLRILALPFTLPLVAIFGVLYGLKEYIGALFYWTWTGEP